MTIPKRLLRPELAPDIRRVAFFDTETLLFSAGRKFPPIVCLQLGMIDLSSTGDGWELEPTIFTENIKEVAEELLLDEETLLVAHHAPYDLLVLGANFPELLPLVRKKLEWGMVSDTKIREKLIRIATGEMSSDPSAGAAKQAKFDLGEIVRRRFGVDLEESKHGADSWRLRYGELQGVPVSAWPDAAREYALDDVRWLRRLWEDQETRPEEPTAWPVDGLRRDGWGITNEAEQLRHAVAFEALEGWGVVTDVVAVNELLAACQREVTAADEVLKAHGVLKGHIFKRGEKAGTVEWSKDTKVLKGMIEGILGAKTPMTAGREKNGVRTPEVSTSQDAIKAALAVQPHPALQALDDTTQVRDIMVKWADVLREGCSRPIHARYNSLAETGRSTSFKPNLQNPPRKGGVRECIVPRPGYVFCFADYSTLELRALAQVTYGLFGYSRMRDMINAGQDLHLGLCAIFNNKSYEETKAAFDAKETWAVEGRQMMKAFNFGVPGGLGAQKFVAYAWDSYRVRLAPTTEEAEERFRFIKNQVYLELFPEMREYFALMSKLTSGGSATITQIPTGRVRGDVSYTVACNTLFQGAASDGAKRSLYDLFWEGLLDTHSPLYGARPALFLHDENGLEVPLGSREGRKERLHHAAHRVSAVMVDAMQKILPDMVVEAAPVLMFRWYKGADPVFENGLLVPGMPVPSPKNPKKQLWVPDPRVEE